MSTDKLIRAIAQRPKNRRCFDCGASGSYSVVPSLSIFVCMDCSGRHIKCGQRAKNLSMSNFTAEEISALDAGGNAVAESTWLAKWKPESDISRPVSRNLSQIDAWIQAVFLEKRYYSASAPAAAGATQRGRGHAAEQIPVRPLSEVLGGAPGAVKLTVSSAPSLAGSPAATSPGVPATALPTSHAVPPAATAPPQPLPLQPLQPRPPGPQLGSTSKEQQTNVFPPGKSITQFSAFAAPAAAAAAAAAAASNLSASPAPLGFTDNAFVSSPPPPPPPPSSAPTTSTSGRGAASPPSTVSTAAASPAFDPFGSFFSGPPPPPASSTSAAASAAAALYPPAPPAAAWPAGPSTAAWVGNPGTSSSPQQQQQQQLPSTPALAKASMGWPTDSSRAAGFNDDADWGAFAGATPPAPAAGVSVSQPQPQSQSQPSPVHVSPAVSPPTSAPQHPNPQYQHQTQPQHQHNLVVQGLPRMQQLGISATTTATTTTTTTGDRPGSRTASGGGGVHPQAPPSLPPRRAELPSALFSEPVLPQPMGVGVTGVAGYRPLMGPPPVAPGVMVPGQPAMLFADPGMPGVAPFTFPGQPGAGLPQGLGVSAAGMMAPPGVLAALPGVGLAPQPQPVGAVYAYADGKPVIDDELEDDPFEGLELGEDAPEPTQEEMDEWATLDTPDEEASPTLATRSKTLAEPVAPSSIAPVSDAPKSAKPEEEAVTTAADTNKEKQTDKPGDTAPIDASIVTTAQPEAKPEVLLPAAEPQAEGATALAPVSVPANFPRAAEVSEITPAISPIPPQPTENKRSFVREEEVENFEQEDKEGEGTQLLQDQQGHLRQGTGGGWGVGWGSGWGLGALGGKLREVAAGAVRDVKDLTETFQAALADVTGAEEEVEEARRISAMDRAAEAEAAGVVSDDPSGGEEGGAAGTVLPTDAPRQAAEPAREAALPVRGAGAGTRSGAADSVRGSAGGSLEPPSPPADPALEVGLQAIDAQVEQLATGAARAFSSLWGGLSSVAKVVAAEVVASVADVQSSEAVRGVAQIGTKLAHTAERGLETVGRTAMVLLEEVAGVGGGGHPGRRRIWGEDADARAADMGREPSSFQDFFYIYGGEQLAEEVNNLSNECSHLCNKSRSKLEGDQQQALDEALGRLGPYFNDPWVAAKAETESEAGKDAAADGKPEAAGPVVPELDDGSKEAAERLGQMYEPIGYLCQDSQSRAEAFLHQLVEAVAAAKEAEAASASRARRERRQPGDGDEAEAEGEDDVEERELAALLRQQVAEPRVVLDSFRAHFTKRLAEVTTAQLQLMLNLGASLAAPARTGRPAVDGIAWPDSSDQQAALLAAEARRMVADLRAISAAYAATLDALASTMTSPEGGNSEAEVITSPAFEGKELDEMAAVLAANSQSAAATIQSGYKGLLYAVLLRGLVTQIAQEEQQPQHDQQEGLDTQSMEGGDRSGMAAAQE
ncbi:hypothetical protein VOLCADRAFT_120813 [Volvox carteri f. nagariensis]|uniref:Arf-GAP domain-containing protein n=1 Tax=Volvox carteri f. nagariensis TaxID=3068 RepID=D8TTX8_VOLCA|nr:uncharacterized protein VOLCADRAFT_120813 [Volvox carteri f. nagariensis]EFJ49044.1 hypothetical protein VOLCADRAFT_120813 [Volvox carteri f. nagariensis]|eukprot:XP_002949941.1 hypothetical protein VOLCADRAFT_120813 [Volvox carteri f. nagariensis]